MADIVEMNVDKAVPIDVHVGLVYDSVWALALGLNNSLKYLKEQNLQLHEYNYTEPFLDAVMRGMHEVEFTGASGLVAFDDRGHRLGVTNVELFYNDTFTDVAHYETKTDNLIFVVQLESIWHGKKVPQDSFEYIRQPVAVSSLAFGLIVACSIAACCVSLAFLSFNIYNRNQKFIKLSSPLLNNVIICGSFLMYVEVLVYAVDYIEDNEMGNMCMVKVWLIAVGFTTIFGALFAKTYRVYVIFRNEKLRKRIIKDLHLFGIIALMLTVDVIILIPWSILNPLKKNRLLGPQVQINNNLISIRIYYYCSNESQEYWIAALYVYKGLMLAFGVFLAWETRHVSVPALNDSKYIGACIYNVVIACIFGVPLAHALPVDESLLTLALHSSLILFCTLICLCIIFVPKVQARNQVHSRFVTEQMVNRTVTTMAVIDKGPAMASVDNNTKGKTVDDLLAENNKLRMEIAEEAIAIAKLRRALIQTTGNLHFYRSGSEYILFKADQASSSNLGALNTDFLQSDFPEEKS